MLSEVTHVYRNQVKLVTGLRGEPIYTENVIRGNPRLQKSGKTSYRTQRGADIYRKWYQRQHTSTEIRN